MHDSAALPIAPTFGHAREDGDGPPRAASHPAQGVEDLRLAERVGRALRATGYGALRAVEVSVDARIVHIAGRVPSYYMKQVAQEAALAVPGTRQVRNDLDVTPST